MKKLNIWLVKLEESTPFDDNYRPMRMEMLASSLSGRGHNVTRWCSCYNHRIKKDRFKEDSLGLKAHGITYNFIYSPVRYKSSVSLLRLVNNEILAIKFYLIGRKSKAKPDIIICSVPTISMALSSAFLKRYHKTLLMLDARDFWPDIFDIEVRGLKRIFMYPAIAWMRLQLGLATKSAKSLIGITPFFRDYLLRYSKREITEFDNHFPLGYIKPSEDYLNSQESEYFWHDKKIDFDKKIIYFAGTINRTFANAFKSVSQAIIKINKTGLGVQFVFCGGGDQLSNIQRLYSGLPNVVFVGHIEPNFLAYLASKSYLAILPIERRIDYQNSLSNKFFEYLANSLPILSGLDGYPAGVIKKHSCGRVYHDETSLYESIKEYVNNQEMRDQESSNALRLFNTVFSYDVVYKKFSKHVEMVASREKQ